MCGLLIIPLVLSSAACGHPPIWLRLLAVPVMKHAYRLLTRIPHRRLPHKCRDALDEGLGAARRPGYSASMRRAVDALLARPVTKDVVAVELRAGTWNLGRQ